MCAAPLIERDDEFCSAQPMTGAPSDLALVDAPAGLAPIDKRSATRFSYSTRLVIQTASRAFRGRAMNISESGICLKVHGLGGIERGTLMTLYIGSLAPIEATARWVKQRTVGAQFLTPLSGHAARLVKALADEALAGDPAGEVAKRRSVRTFMPPEETDEARRIQ